MQIRSETIGTDITALYLDGRLNMVSAPALRQAVQDAIATGHPCVVLELTDVSSIDSVGLGTLIGCRKSTLDAGGDLRITSPTTQVQTMLKLSLLDQVFPARESVEAAYSA